jgi:hypothetical protein
VHTSVVVCVDNNTTDANQPLSPVPARSHSNLCIEKQ